MITDKARNLLANHLKSIILSGQVGLGGNNTSPAATTLDVPITGITVSKSADLTDENIIQVKLEILGNAITGKVIREVGLFNHATPASGDLLQRFNFDGVGPFGSTERLQIYITMEIE
jgi:hypothetical protein|tara:strand:+ start:754 stop:1107 length:354 start_codon:yes stop_codon:yes gene_type:complete